MIMTTLTPHQKRVLNGIKFFQAEYTAGVPYNILKLDLDILEEDLNPILGYLEEAQYISRQDGNIILKKDPIKDRKGEDFPREPQLNEKKETPKGADEEIVSDSSLDDAVDSGDVNDAGEVINTGDMAEAEPKDQLSETEKQSLEIIGKLVDDSGNISRTLLEGTLLYGELELSSISMYNLITSLEYKGILKKISLTDGEYYSFTP